MYALILAEKSGCLTTKDVNSFNLADLTVGVLINSPICSFSSFSLIIPFSLPKVRVSVGEGAIEKLAKIQGIVT